MTGRTHRTTRGIAALAAAGLVLAACGGSDSSDSDEPDGSTPASAAEPDATTATSEATETTAAAETGALQGFDNIQPAVVQIIAEGTIRDPEFGQVSNAGSGTGFVISPDGLAVTNNHVVTGAATLEVYIGGELDDSYNARVVGVSECNDLALIDIDAPGDLPYVEWFDGDIRPGLEVYAAGYPLGDPEFTLTRGIIAKAEASGETPWASIDSTVEHDATIQPGNSGGPLVDAEGKVVAVNYATGQGVSASQFFAISSPLAQEVVEELRDGDFESLGINGQAVIDEEGGIAGIWVAGVAPGSPVSDAGVLPGDIVTALNGLPIGTDGTFSDYCDVLRTSAEGAPIQIEVLRFDTSEVLRGELNGDQPLEQVFSFAEELEEEVADEPTDPGAESPAISGYTSVTDDTGALTVDVPVEWSDVSTAPQTLDDGTTVPVIQASTSLVDFNETWNVPGLLFLSLPGSADLDETLATIAPTDCVDGGIQDYSDALYTGRYQTWTSCGGTETIYVTVAAVPADGAFTAILGIQLVSEADLAALDQAFATFVVNA